MRISSIAFKKQGDSQSNSLILLIDFHLSLQSKTTLAETSVQEQCLSHVLCFLLGSSKKKYA